MMLGHRWPGGWQGWKGDGNSAPLEKLLEYQDEIVRIHKEYGYSKSVCKDLNKGIELLYLFLTDTTSHIGRQLQCCGSAL